MKAHWHDSGTRYSNVSIALHWLTFILIFANANIGGYVGRGIKTYKLEYFQIHKSVGIIILALSLFRLGWRLAHRWPVSPPEAKPWEHILARGTHILFYVLIIAVPLGVFTAYKAGKKVDDAANTVAFMLLSIPVFVISSLMILAFSVNKWVLDLPSEGWISFGSSPTEHFKHLIMPIVATGLVSVIPQAWKIGRPVWAR